jgi:putative membrane protein
MQNQSATPPEGSPVSTHSDRPPSASSANLRLVLGLILAGLIVLFTLQNAEVVELRFLFWTWSMPRAVMIFGVLVTGLLLGWILSSWIHHKESGKVQERD